MLLICKAPPPFLQDNAPFIKFFDSELDLNGPTAAFLSTESIFARYERAVAGVAPAPPDAATPTAPPSAGMAQPPAANPPAANPPAEAAPVQVPDRPPALPPRRESPEMCIRDRPYSMPKRRLAGSDQPLKGLHFVSKTTLNAVSYTHLVE